MFIFAPLYGTLLNKLGRKTTLILGCASLGISMFCFGLFVYVNNPAVYGILCFVARFFEGFGNGCMISAANAIISFNYPDNMSSLIGLTQTFTGLGMLAGPILGSLLFFIGGF